MPTQNFVNVLAGSYIERAAHLRKDSDWLDAARARTDSLFVPVWGTRNAVRRDGELLFAHFVERSSESIQPFDPSRTTFLGMFRERACFAFKLDEQQPAPVFASTEFADLRLIVDLLDRNEAGLLAYARALLSWQDRHRFCGRCGSITQLINGGHAVQCSEANCAHEQFPRIDPAIIVLVTDGERALLGRQSAWAPGRYSTIAGFVEPGESLEDAVAREVLEETGVTTDAIEYHSSQPWPFPQSLMLGFIAQARTTSIMLNDNELEDARWFTRADFASGAVQFPPPISISGCLIEHWYNQEAKRPLREEPAAKNWTLRR